MLHDVAKPNPTGYPRSMGSTKWNLGHVIARYRKAAGLTQEELSELIGLSRLAVGRIERGYVERPKDSTLERLEEVIGFPRALAYRLMAGEVSAEDVENEDWLLSIDALPQAQDRVRAFYELPLARQRALLRLMQAVRATDAAGYARLLRELEQRESDLNSAS